MKHTVLRKYSHYIWHHTLHVCVCVITPTVSMIKHTLYLWHHVDCIYGTICTICDISPTIYDITTLYSWHQSYYISPHTDYIWEHIYCISVLQPNYRSYNPHCMYDNTATVCMTSCKLHMTSHPLFMILHHAMTSHPLYSCHHTQDTCHCIRCSWTNTYSVLTIPHLLYVWHETHYKYDITEILYDITLTLYDITILYLWCYNHSIHDSTPTL